MIKKFNLTQITEVSIAYVAERYELSIKYIDDSKYTYGQQNFLHETKELCVEVFKDILKTFGFDEHLNIRNFNIDPDTNKYVLSEKKLREIKEKAGLTSIIEQEGKGKISNFEPTNIQGLYKIKGRDIHYMYKKGVLERLYDIKRTGSFETQNSNKPTTFQTILTYDDQDLIRFFVVKTKENIEYIEYNEDVIKNISLDEKDQNKDKKNSNNI